MTLPTHDELLRERFTALKAEADDLVHKISEDSTREYARLAELTQPLLELSAHFKEPLAFEVDPAVLALKKAVMEAVGPLVK